MALGCADGGYHLFAVHVFVAYYNIFQHALLEQKTS
jgi:hypothetical protein